MVSAVLLTVQQLAEHWQCSLSTIYALVEARDLQCVRIGRGRGCIRFTTENIAEFLRKRLQASSPAPPAPTVSRPPQMNHLSLD